MGIGERADERTRAVQTIASVLADYELQYERLTASEFAVNLPGEQRLKTACILRVGEHALSVEAFVLRKPDENPLGVYTYLLHQNARMYGVAWSIDDTGDVYLTGRLPLAAVTAEEVDRILGSVLEYADTSFNVLLKLGFGSSIRREWAWRVKHNESLVNLAAFADFAQRSADDD